MNTIIEIFSQFTNLELFAVAFILFFSTMIVRIAGFGGALVSMPIVVPILGLAAASPLMNLLGITTFSTVILQKWRELTFKDMWRVALGNIAFVPVGIWILGQVDELWLRLFFGVLCIGYVLIRLANVPPPVLKNPNWGWLYGMVSGIFTGTFSLGGTAAALYADSQRWEPEPFRLNMFSFLAVTAYVNAITRYFAGQFTLTVVLFWIFGSPCILLGIWAGERLAVYVNKEMFQKLVLGLLVVLGGRLIYGVFL
ncbi:MAG: sulfite exporter TauE/SafE family protein [Chloroflexota bacterium]